MDNIEKYDKDELLSVSEYSKRKCITPQAVYKQLNNSGLNGLKQYLVVVDGKKYIKIEALGENSKPEVERDIKPSLETKPSEVETVSKLIEMLQEELNTKNSIIETLTKQLETKDKQIEDYTTRLREAHAIHYLDKIDEGEGASENEPQEAEEPTPPKFIDRLKKLFL